MASLTRKDRSPYWFACFYDEQGKRTKRSTKATDRRKAQSVADLWEAEAKRARRGELTEARVRKVLAEFHENTSGRPVNFYTTRSWLAAWLGNVRGSTKARTITRYTASVQAFLRHLEKKADAPLESLGPDDVRAWRDELEKSGLSPATANQEVRILRMALREAHAAGYSPLNAAATVRRLNDAPGSKRGAFTLAQVVALLAAAPSEDWRGFILLCAFAGLRLRDAADLSWKSVDLAAGLLRVETGKRGVVVVVPLHPDLSAWLKARPRGIGKAPVLPELHGRAGGGKSGLSSGFKKIMRAAGIRGTTVRKGQGAGRTTSDLTQHSLRHFFVNSLSAAGVAADVRKKLAGHRDDKSHAVYTAHEIESARAAVSLLPTLAA